MKRTRIAALAVGVTALALLAACQSTPSLPPVALAGKVDIPRFMGDWYVIGSIPTIFEKDAYSAKDSYRLQPDGRIATTFSYRDGGFDGPAKEMGSTGYVLDANGAVWGQQYIWPIKADYRISYVSPDYMQTVITREKRDYVWIMSRTPTMPDADYQRLVELVRQQGYDMSKLKRAPQ